MKKTDLFILMISLIVNFSLSAQNQVLSLDGDYDYMNSNVSYSNTHKTFELWAKSNIEIGVRAILIGIHNPVANGRFYFGYETGDGYLGLGIGNSGWNNESGGYSIDTNWHHYALIWDEPNMQLYLDGELIAEKSNTSMASDTYFIGAAHIWQSPWSDAHFNGEIDNVCVWDYIRTQQEIQSDMFTTQTGNETGLVAYWNFNDGTANDVTSNNNNGTLNGDAQIITEQIPSFGIGDFAANQTIGQVPFPVNFTDLTDGIPTNWQWDFQNDGIVDDTIQNPSFIYTMAGTYSIKLIASDNFGNSDTIIKIDHITVYDLNDGLVAHFPFNGNAIDESGNGNNGTVNGATLTTDRFGNSNSAYVFDGSNDNIEILDDATLDITNSISLSVWFNFNSDPYTLTTQRAYVIDKMWAWRLWYSPNGYGYSYEDQFFFDIWDWDGVSTQSIIWNTNEWYNLICTYDGNIARVYVNGVLNNQIDIIKTLHTSSDNLFIGQGFSDGYVPDFHNGNLDDIRIYNRALSEEEIQSLYSKTPFELSVFLEGPYNATDMNTDLNPDPIQLSQPYNNPQKWNYQGTESVASIPNEDIVDWVLVELRETSGNASTAIADSTIARKAAFLLKDGSIVDLDGETILYFDNEITDNLFVVIYHRNHLPVMSSEPLTENNGYYSWNFTIPEGQAYGIDAQKNLGTVYGMIGGDTDASGIIDMDDKDLYWSTDAGNTGYYPSDLNLDSHINNPDKNDIWEPNLDKVSELPVPCGDPIVDVRDGKTYNTVQIGTQCWMAENLNIGNMINGSDNQIDNSTIEKYCYDNSTNNCDTYGGLYQWDEMMEYVTIEGSQGICPTGWHIPTDADWCTLENYVDVGTVDCGATGWRGVEAGGNLKEIGTSHWASPNTGATNLSGFTGLPAGYRHTNNSFYYLSYSTYMWSSNESASNAWLRLLYNNFAQVYRYNEYKNFGFSVRCLQD